MEGDWFALMIWWTFTQKENEGIAAGRGGPPGGNSGSIWFNLVQIGSIKLGFGWKQALQSGVGPALRTEAKDLQDVSMRAHETKNASKCETYRRILHRPFVCLMGDRMAVTLKSGEMDHAREQGNQINKNSFVSHGIARCRTPPGKMLAR